MATMDWSAQSGSAPATYDEFLVPAMFAPFAERLLDRAEARPGLRVLDVGPTVSKALAEMRRVLKPEARLAVATWKDIEHSPFLAIAEALARHVSSDVDDVTACLAPHATADGRLQLAISSNVALARA
jgi:hypothetical protein